MVGEQHLVSAANVLL